MWSSGIGYFSIRDIFTGLYPQTLIKASIMQLINASLCYHCVVIMFSGQGANDKIFAIHKHRHRIIYIINYYAGYFIMFALLPAL